MLADKAETEAREAQQLADPGQGVARRFALSLLGAAGGAMFLIFLLVQIVDPYGISPLGLRLDGFNTAKPYRDNLDRYIKPLEVWSKQPDTIFLGTSRVHQSIEPKPFQDLAFGKIYNASIPASTLGENAASLDLYIKINPNLKRVVLEIFPYNFFMGQAQSQKKQVIDLIEDSLPLVISFQAVTASFGTLFANLSDHPDSASVSEYGAWIPPEGFGPGSSFGEQLYVQGIVAAHKNIPDLQVQASALAEFQRIVSIAKDNELEIYLVVFPAHTWDCYRLFSYGYWDRIETLYRLLSEYPNFYSFANVNFITTETPQGGMRWWYDPLHVTPEVGDMIMASVLGDTIAEPQNFMKIVTPENVDAVLKAKRADLMRWQQDNPEFSRAFEAAKKAYGQSE